MRALPCLLLAAWLVPAPAVVAQRGELIERTLAIVGTQVITLSDARAVLRLGLVEADRSADPVSLTQQLVDRELILREVQRYAPPAPSDSAVDAGMDKVRKRLPGPTELSGVLDETGFTEARLRAWIRDDLRAVAYLAQRFAAASSPVAASRRELIADWVSDLRRRTDVVILSQTK